MDVLYTRIFSYGSLQFCGHVEEYLASHTEDLLVYIVQPRLDPATLGHTLLSSADDRTLAGAIRRALDTVAEVAVRAEQLGFESLWVSDHFFSTLERYGGGPQLTAAQAGTADEAYLI